MHLRPGPCRKAACAAGALTAFALLAAGCSSTPASTRPTGVDTGRFARRGVVGPSLAPATVPTTLPASHDNDAGIARTPDAVPDADTDAVQRPPAGYG